MTLVRLAVYQLSIGLGLQVLCRWLLRDRELIGWLVPFMVLSAAYCVAGTLSLMRARGRAGALAWLGLIAPLGIAIAVCIPRRRDFTEQPDGRVRELIRPAGVVLLFVIAIVSLWLTAGNLAGHAYSKYEEARWTRRFDAPPPLARNSAARQVEMIARRLDIDFNNATRTTTPKEMKAFRDALLASDSAAPVVDASVRAFIEQRDAAVRELEAVVWRQTPVWSFATQKSARAAVFALHRIRIVASFVREAAGDRSGSESSLRAASRLTEMILASRDEVMPILGASAVEVDAAASLRIRGGSSHDAKGVHRRALQFLADEVTLVARTIEREGALPTDGWLLRELLRPYTSCALGDYRRAWRERIAAPGTQCRGGIREIDAPRWNLVARIAAPTPEVTERFYRAALAQELADVVSELRGRVAMPRVGIKSAICSDVMWIVEARSTGGEARIDRPFALRNEKAPKLALRYRW